MRWMEVPDNREATPMRSTLRRVQLGLGAFTAATVLLLVAPSPASAGPCYTVGVGPQSVTVCPGS